MYNLGVLLEGSDAGKQATFHVGTQLFTIFCYQADIPPLITFSLYLYMPGSLSSRLRLKRARKKEWHEEDIRLCGGCPNRSRDHGWRHGRHRVSGHQGTGSSLRDR
jgi:hypothetical protein